MSPTAALDRSRSVDALLTALQASDPGRPRVTWYGPGGERVELSARVLANWVAKTGNLLVEECGLEPGGTVRLDLPVHWRGVVGLLAAWSVGAGHTDDDGADVLLTSRPEDGVDAGTVVAVALPALARRFEGPGSWDVDYAAEVPGFADEPLHTVDDDPAGVLAPARAAAGGHGWPDRPRVLVPADGYDPVTVVLAALARDGSVVLVTDPDADLSRVEADEQTTTRVTTAPPAPA